MTDGSGSPSRAPLAPPASSVVSPEVGGEKTKPSSPHQWLDFKEDIIDGFSISSFATAKDLESFIGRPRLEFSSCGSSTQVFDRSTLKFEDSDDRSNDVSIFCALSKSSELTSTMSDDEIERPPPLLRSPPSLRPPPTTEATTAYPGRLSPSRKSASVVVECPDFYSSAGLLATSSVLNPLHPESSDNNTQQFSTPSTDTSSSSSPARRRPESGLEEQAPARMPSPFPGLPGDVAVVAGAKAPSIHGLSGDDSVANLSPDVTCASNRRAYDGDDSPAAAAGRGDTTRAAAAVLAVGRQLLPPPSKKMLLLLSGQNTKPTLETETGKSLKTVSDDLNHSERCLEIPNGLANDVRCGWSLKGSMGDPFDPQMAPQHQLQGGTHSESRISERRDCLSYAANTKVRSSAKLSPSLANCYTKGREFKKKDANNRCGNSSVSRNNNICPDVSVNSQIFGFPQPLDQNSSHSSSWRPVTSSPPKPAPKPEYKVQLCPNQSPSRGTADSEAGLFMRPSNCHVTSSQTKRGGVSHHVVSTSSSSLPERESVIVREHSGHHHQSVSNIPDAEKESRSPFAPAFKATASQASEIRSSSAVNSFPLFPSFDKEPSIIHGHHPVYFAAPHPAFTSNFSTSSLPFGLPPFQHSGMFAPSLGFPPSALVTSPLMDLSSRFHPETMLSVSATPSQEILTRLQQELNTRFLQDRGLLPITPFTLHAELHQHQHLHHHQHLLPGSYLPPPPLVADALSLGKLQSSQNLSDFINREQLAKASCFGSFSGFGSQSMVGGLPAPLPFGSGLSGAFQPKSGLSSLNLTSASQLLLSLRDRDPFSAATNQLPQAVKKRGLWRAAHVQTAWKIHKMKRNLTDDDNNQSSLKLLQHDYHSRLLPPGASRLQFSGDRMRPNALIDSVLPPFGRLSNFGVYDGLDLPFARKLAYDAALNHNILRPSEWNGYPPPHQPAGSLLVPGSWPKSSGNTSRENIGSSEWLSEHKDRSLVINSCKSDNRIIGNESHKGSEALSSTSRPASNANSVSSERLRSPSSSAHKGNGHFRSRSRSRSPLKFSTSRSSASLNGLAKEPRDEEIRWKTDLGPDHFQNVRSQDSFGTIRSGLAVKYAGYSNVDKAAIDSGGHYQSELFRPPRTREPASTDILARDRLVKDSPIFTGFDCRRHLVHPALHASDFYMADICRPSAGRLFSHHSPLPPGGLPPPLVRSSCSPPSPLSAGKNSRVQNGWSNSSAGLIEIPSDNGLILR